MNAKDPILEEIVKRLVTEFSPEKIYLFGSRARNDDDQNSDYDILLIVKDSDEPAYKRAQKAHRVLRGLGTATDVLVWKKEDFEKRLHLVASFPSTVEREGKVIYNAA